MRAVLGVLLALLVAPLSAQQTRDSVYCAKCIPVRDSTRDSVASTVNVPVTSWRVVTRVTTTYRDSVVKVPVTPAPVPPPPPPAPTPTLTVTAAPQTVASGEQVTFSWRATGMTGNCSVSDGRQTATGQPLEASHRVTVTRTTTVTVRCGTLTRSATATVTAAPVPPPPPPAPEPEPEVPPSTPGNPSYPNRPANYTRVISEYGFGDAVPTNQEGKLGNSGWLATWNGSGLTRRGTDATAPVSPSSVLEWAYTRTGTPVGGGVGNVARYLSPNLRQVYIAFWMKHDSQFEWNPISNKLVYLEPGNIILQSRHWDQYFTLWIGAHGVDSWPQRNMPIPLGQWQRVEYLVDGVAGFIRVWVDGVLVNSYTGRIPTPWSELKLDSTWGGAGGTKTRDSFRWMDHILVATVP